MNKCGKIGLGTVQWGMDYGIANRAGRPSAVEVRGMLRFAGEAGIELLDTAHAYGEAESVLGEHHAASQGFRIVTKTKPIQSLEVTTQDVSAVSAAFHLSLQRLGCPHVYGLLVHNADSLLTPGGDLLWKALQDFKSCGLVEKVGVSVYRPQQLKTILERYPIDLVQLPFNIYDQRFAQTGLLDRLKQSNIEIHARSAFLQGLLLFPPDQLPPHFFAIREHQSRLHEFLRQTDLTPLGGCLLYCLQHSHIDYVIVGCEASLQIAEVCELSRKGTPGSLSALAEFALQDEEYINPSIWPKWKKKG